MTDSEAPLICYCGQVGKGRVLQAIAAGAATLQQLREMTGVCPENADCARNNPTGKCCAPDILALLREHACGHAESDALTACSCCSPGVKK